MATYFASAPGHAIHPWSTECDLPALSKLALLAQADLETVMGRWGVRRFVADVLAPSTGVGDTAGARRDPATGRVTTSRRASPMPTAATSRPGR